MREHQKYFAVVDADGQLMPCFVARQQYPCQRRGTWWPKAMSAYCALDCPMPSSSTAPICKQSMEAWNERLKGVLFQAQLGSMHAKVQRVQHIGPIGRRGRAADQAPGDRGPRNCARPTWSVRWSIEFPNLQGIMGRHLCRHAGEDPDVASAIEEHYRPTYSGGPLPQNRVGALLAIADKLDTICGCFSVGLMPTGASDPYALQAPGYRHRSNHAGPAVHLFAAGCHRR